MRMFPDGDNVMAVMSIRLSNGNVSILALQAHIVDIKQLLSVKFISAN